MILPYVKWNMYKFYFLNFGRRCSARSKNPW